MTTRQYTTEEESRFYGKCIEWSAFSTHYLSPFVRVQKINAVLGSVLKLPKANLLPTGGPIWRIQNTNNSNDLTVQDWDGTEVGTISGGDEASIHLLDNSDEAGSWLIASEAWSIATVSNDPPTGAFFLGGSEDSSNAREFNYHTDAWTERTDGTNDHRGGSGFGIPTAGFVAGHQSTLKHDLYAPNAWVSKTDAPGTVSRHQASGVMISLDGFLFGGFDGATTQSRADTYSVAGNSWSSIAALSLGLAYAACSEVDGLTAYIMGGSLFADFSLSQRKNQQYTKATEAYSEFTRFPYPGRSEADSAVVDSKIYMMGGTDDSSAMDDCEAYDPSTQAWSRVIPNVPSGNVYGGGAVATGDASVLFCGGRTTPVSLTKDDCAEYHPLTLSWTTRTDIDVETAQWDQQCHGINN